LSFCVLIVLFPTRRPKFAGNACTT